MMRMVPVTLDNGATVLGVEVKLPKTTLVVLTTDKGYIMCGALILLPITLSFRDL